MHRRLLVLVVLGLATVGGLFGCAQDQQFEGAGVYAFAMDESVPPIMSSMMDGDIYWIEQRINLPIVEPTADEMAALNMIPAGMTLPWPRMPWVQRGDLDLEVDVTVSSLQTPDPSDPNATDRVTLTVNGINEFDEYVPGIETTREGFLIHFSQWERAFDIKRGERRTFTIRQEEISEVATDLATVVNGAPNPNEIVYFANQSDHDPRALPYIPPVIPGLVGMRVGLMTFGQVRLVAETSIRVHDNASKRAEDGTTPWAIPMQRQFITTDVYMTPP